MRFGIKTPRRVGRWWRRAGLLAGGQPQWGRILRPEKAGWEEALRRSATGPCIAIPTSVGCNLAATRMESLLAVALTLRGARVEILLCDRVLPICQEILVTDYPEVADFSRRGAGDLCRACFASAARAYRVLGLPLRRYGEFVGDGEVRQLAARAARRSREEMAGWVEEGIPLGEHALAGTLRFYAKGILEDEPGAEQVLRRNLVAALITRKVWSRLLQQHPVEGAVFHLGIYVPQGIVGAVLRKHGVRVVNWMPAYRDKTFIFSHGDTYHHALRTEPVEKWENLAWNVGRERELKEYLQSRWRGTRDWIWFHEKPEVDLACIAAECGIDFSRPVIGMLTNVMWDAQLHYPAKAFPDMRDWVLKTIGYFKRRPGLQLVIRAHPAEIRGTTPSRQPIAREIGRYFPRLPPNVVVIPPESRVSTYAVMEKCNAAIIYGTKMGVELAAMGIPIVAAGEAWIRDKGIALEAASEQEYYRLLDRLPLSEKMADETVARARRYAYHFFFRRMIPVAHFEKNRWRRLVKAPYAMRIKSLDDLRPGRDRGLDIICEGILRGRDFIYPAEEIAAAGTGEGERA